MIYGDYSEDRELNLCYVEKDSNCNIITMIQTVYMKQPKRLSFQNIKLDIPRVGTMALQRQKT